MSNVLDFFREQEPRFADVSDADLTRFVGDEYPDFLQDKRFAHRYRLVGQQAEAAARGDVGSFEFLEHPDDPAPKYSGNARTQGGLGLMEGSARLGEQSNTVLAEMTHAAGERVKNSTRAQRAGGLAPHARNVNEEQFRGAAEIAGAKADEIAELRSETGGPKFVGDITQGATSLVPSLAVAPAGLPAMAITAGLQSYGGALRESEKHYRAQGFTPEDAREVSRPSALASAFVTALVTAGFGKTGVEAINKLNATGGLKAKAIEFARQAGYEGAEEWTDQLLQGGIQKLSWREDITFPEALVESAEAGGIGMILGGAANIPRLLQPDGRINPDRIKYDEQKLKEANAELDRIKALKQKFEDQTDPERDLTEAEQQELQQELEEELAGPVNAQPENEQLPRPVTTPSEPQPQPPTSRRVEPLPASKTDEGLNTFPIPDEALTQLDQLIQSQPAAPAVPLGSSRPAVADDRLRQMTDDAFDAHRIRVRKEIDELERLLDEGELDEAGERKLATVQDQFSAMETEEARRSYEGQYVGDVFREMLDLADARPGSQKEMNLIMAAEVLQAKRPSDADLAEGFDWVGPALANDPNWKEVQGIKYERLQTRLQELGIGKPAPAVPQQSPATITGSNEQKGSEMPAEAGATPAPEKGVQSLPPMRLPSAGVNSKDIAKTYGLPDDFYTNGQYLTDRYHSAVNRVDDLHKQRIRGVSLQQAQAELREAWSEVVAGAKGGETALEAIVSNKTYAEYINALDKAFVGEKVGEGFYRAQRQRYTLDQWPTQKPGDMVWDEFARLPAKVIGRVPSAGGGLIGIKVQRSNGEQGIVAVDQAPALQKWVDYRKEKGKEVPPAAIEALTSASIGDGPKPAPRTDKAENSTSEKPAPDSASTIPSERPKQPAVKGRRSAPRAAVGDILDDIERVGGMMSASRARKELGGPWWKENKSLYEGLAPLPPAHNFIYGGRKSKFKHRPDQALQALQESDEFTGKYDAMSLEEFKAEIGKASRERIETTKTRKREEKWLREEGRQLLNWEKATDTGAKPVQGGDLGIGDTLDVEGTPLEVIEVDPDTGDVILKDGKRFGRQRVGAEEIIYVEQIEQADRGHDVAPTPAPAFNLEVHDDQTFQAEQDKIAAQQQAKAQQEELQARQSAPLEGTTGDLGQGDLLGGGDLFAPPSPNSGTDTPFAVNRATLPRQIDDATARPSAPGNPVHPQQVREYLQAALDVPFRVGAGGKAGFFRNGPEVIRTRKTLLNSLTVASHEIGHYLHKIAFPDIAIGNAEQSAAVAELMALGAPGRGNSSANASSTKDYQLGEGVAEFIRLYLTDPATAQAEAPRFHRYATEHLAAHHPQIRHILDTAQEMITEHINQPIGADLDSMINWTPKAKGQTFTEWWDKVYDDWFNELAPLERAEQRLIDHGLDQETATRASQLATNYLGGWVGKVEYSLYQRQIGFDGQDVGPALREILSGVEDINDFAKWLAGNRIIEKELQGKTTGVNRNKLNELGKWLRERAPKYESTWKQLDKFLTNELQISVDAGFLSPSEAKRIKKSNQFYVPFQRDEHSMGGKGGGRGFADVAKPLKAFVGSDGRIFNPLESIIKNVYNLRDASERNRVSLALADAINRTDGGGRIGDRPAKKLKPDDIEVPSELLVQWARDMDLDLDPDQEAEIRERMLAQPLAFRLWRLHHQQADPAQGIFQIWREGKRERWQIDDPELYKALQLADATDAATASKWPLYRSLNFMTRVLRSGATLTIEFMGRNIMRDPITAAVYSKYGFVPFVDSTRGLFSALKKDKWYWDYVKAGGRYSDLVASDRKDLRAKLEEVTDTETAAQMVAKWGNPLLTLQKMSEKMELATRLAEFRRAKEAGASDLEAANASKDVTLNFARGGFKGRALNRIIPFYNAQLQDLDKFRREHDPRNLRNAASVAAKGFLYITMPSLLTWWLGHDDEEIQKLPEWRKQFFWNIRVGDQVFSLPKPFLLGQVYGTSVERSLDYAAGKDPNAVKKWFRDTLQMANPIPMLNPSVMPAGVKPMIEGAANYSFFREAPLEGSADQRLPKAFRATPATSETAKYLSRLAADVLGDEERTISPIVLDNTIRGTMGGLGKYGTDAIDFLAAKSGLVDVPPKPVKRWTEYPGIRAFAKSPYAANADVQRFYEGLRRAEQTVATMRDFQTIMDPKAGTYWKANAARIAHYQSGGDYSNLRRLRQHSDGLSSINKAMLVARESRTLTPRQKADRLTTLAAQRNELAGNALQFLHPKDRKRTR